MAEGLWNGLQALTQGPEPDFQSTVAMALVPTGNPRMERVRNKHSNTYLPTAPRQPWAHPESGFGFV